MFNFFKVVYEKFQNIDGNIQFQFEHPDNIGRSYS